MRYKMLLISTMMMVSSCATQSARPPITNLCSLDVPAAQGVCGNADHGATPVRRVPIAELDKYVCVPVEDWHDLMDHLVDVEYKANQQ